MQHRRRIEADLVRLAGLRRISSGALALFAAASVAANLRYGSLVAGAPNEGSDMVETSLMISLLHALPPVALLVAIEVLARVWGAVPRRILVAGAGSVIVVIAASFVMSFESLRSYAISSQFSPAVAWLLPVILDVGMVGFTLVTLGLSSASSTRRVELAELEADATVLLTPPTPDDVLTSDPVRNIDMLRSPDLDNTPTQHVAPDDAALLNTDVLTSDVVEPEPTLPQRADIASVTPSPAPPAAPSVTVPEPEPAPDPLPSPVAVMATPADVESPTTPAADDLAALARAVVETRGIRASADEVATVLRSHRDGASQTEIAAAVNRSRQAIAKWLTAAKEIDPAYAAAVDREVASSSR
jgi:hypothetical protein